MQNNMHVQEHVSPAIEPVTLIAAKEFLKLEHDADDAVILDLITAARQFCEDYTGRSFITRSYKYVLDQWPQDKLMMLSLPKPPLQNMISIHVYGGDGDMHLYDPQNYYCDHISIPGRVMIKTAHMAPTPARPIAGIEILYHAGYGYTDTDVPAPLRQAVLRLTAYLYEHRDMHDNMQDALKMSGAVMLLSPYKIMGLT